MRLDHLLSKEEKVEVVFLLSHQGVSAAERLYERMTIFLVAIRLGETPVHIPNTMVKP